MIKWCESCEHGIAKHRCKCDFCDTIHLLCNECYQEGKDSGNVIDRVTND